MKKTGRIVKVGSPRTYDSRYGEITNTPVVFEWNEEGANGSYEQALCIEVRGHVNPQRCSAAIASKEEVTVNFYLGCQESTKTPGTFFNRITGNLPKEFMED